jgi:hypothetical protein
MDPITTALVTALTAGATSGLTDIAKKAIEDGYSGLKSLVHTKFGQESKLSQAVEELEAKPKSDGRKTTLAEEMEDSGAASDKELLASAQALLKLMEGLPKIERNVQIAKGSGIAQAQGGSTASATISGNVPDPGIKK